MIEVIGAAYATAATIGALHGVEPGHGWPVAATYALGRRRPWASGTLAGLIIGGAHLVSSFAVVALFEVLNRWIDLTETGWVGPVAGLALIVMGIVQWRRGGHSHGPEDHSQDSHHDHSKGASVPIEETLGEKGLWGIAVFAFALGFAHEEEFAIVALCAGRANCWGVMAVYAIAVASVILALTLVSVAAFDRFRERLEPWRNRLPRISAVILIAMGLAYAVAWL
ncbi:high frequency lysogenization protein HflD [soil metagenome]